MSSEGRESEVTGRGYQQLRAWQKAHELALGSFRAAEELRRSHGWLANQLARSAVSVAANIAEGYSRGSLREYLHFLKIARGSLAETEYYIVFAQDARLLSSEKIEELGSLVDDAGSLLLGLIRSLQKKDESNRGDLLRDESAIYSIDAGCAELEPALMTRDP